MTWIKTIPISESDEKLRRVMKAQRELYPSEYVVPVHGYRTAGVRTLSRRTA